MYPRLVIWVCNFLALCLWWSSIQLDRGAFYPQSFKFVISYDLLLKVYSLCLSVPPFLNYSYELFCLQQYRSANTTYTHYKVPPVSLCYNTIRQRQRNLNILNQNPPLNQCCSPGQRGTARRQGPWNKESLRWLQGASPWNPCSEKRSKRRKTKGNAMSETSNYAYATAFPETQQKSRSAVPGNNCTVATWLQGEVIPLLA